MAGRPLSAAAASLSAFLLAALTAQLAHATTKLSNNVLIQDTGYTEILAQRFVSANQPAVVCEVHLPKEAQCQLKIYCRHIGESCKMTTCCM